MEKHSLKKKIRLFIWVSVALLLVIMLIDFGANLYVNHLFRKQVREFERKTSGFYRIKYGRIRISIPFNQIILNDFHLFPEPDPRGEPKNSPYPERYYRIELPLLKIKGISMYKYLFFKSLDIRRIILKNPKITVFKHSKKASKLSPDHPLEKDITIPINIRSLLVHFTRIKNGSFSVIEYPKKSGEASTFTLDFMLRELKLGFHKPGSGLPILKPDSLDFVANRIQVNLPDKLYSVAIEEMGVSAPMRRIWLKSASVVPRYPKYQFSRKIGYRMARKSLTVKWAHIHGVDMARIIEKNTFKAQLFSARGIYIEFFSNRHIPRRAGIRPKKFPQQYLREMKLKLHLEKVKFSDGYIVYEEGIGKSKNTAKVFFSRVKMDIDNITNIPGISSDQDDLRIRTSSKFMARTDFGINMTISIQDQLDRFTFSGNMGAIRGSVLNPILKNNSIHIESGHLNRVSFQASGNRIEARGKMKLYYQNLKISLLRKRKLNRKDKLTSFFINRIIQSGNPRKNRQLRAGNMYYQRKSAKSIFNLIWKSFLNGVKSSIGLKKKKK